MNRLIRSLVLYFNQLDNPGLIQGSQANFSYVDDGLIVVGLVKSNTLNGAVLAAAVTIDLVDSANFPISGTAYILDGAISDKIQYTGKSTNTLTGVTGVVNGHSGGQLVVASARTGDVFIDTLNENTLKIIP
jgi:hypothetical protein